MKVKISFEITYDDPKDEWNYNVLIEKLRYYYENEMVIQSAYNASFIELSKINITDDYKLSEKE